MPGNWCPDNSEKKFNIKIIVKLLLAATYQNHEITESPVGPMPRNCVDVEPLSLVRIFQDVVDCRKTQFRLGSLTCSNNVAKKLYP